MRRAENESDNPDDILRELVGRPCVGAIAQPETDGDLLLDFGGWQSYDDRRDERLLATERGKWTLMIGCPWRLDGPKSPVCDWRSVAEPAGRFAEAHLVFEGLSVEDLFVHRPGIDLELRLSRGFVLRVFCDSAGNSEECWYLLRPDGSSVTATREFRLVSEPSTSGS